MQVPFIDLKVQYKALKNSIDSRIQKVLDHGGYINGPEVAECEKVLAQFAGSKYALACASGTDALLMPLMAAGIGPGDEVITTAFSFIATAETIVLAGAKPIYVDIDPKTFNIDVTKIEKAITSKTKAIMPVSLYGQVCEMDEINALAKKHGLVVVEDAAQSYGATYKGKRSCNVSDVGGTSFYPAKPLGCYGDGGAIFTSDDKLFNAMKEIRDHGSSARYHHTRLGLNGRLDTIQCAVILAKMERYPWEIEQRDRIAKRYNDAFSSIKAKNFQAPFVHSHNTSVWAQYTLTVNDRPQFQKMCSEAGVPTVVHYPCTMPEQPWYKEHAGTISGDIKNAQWAAQHVVSLPFYPDMDTKTQDYAIEQIARVVKECS